MLYFFRSLVGFNWIEGHLIPSRVVSGRIWLGSDQLTYLKKLSPIELTTSTSNQQEEIEEDVFYEGRVGECFGQDNFNLRAHADEGVHSPTDTGRAIHS
jgi:hypothetical protein